MLMKWSRPGGARAPDAGGGDVVVGAGGFTPRTLSRKQEELKQLQQDKKMTTSELRDIGDQLEQIELEKVIVAPASSISSHGQGAAPHRSTSSLHMRSRRARPPLCSLLSSPSR